MLIIWINYKFLIYIVIEKVLILQMVDLVNEILFLDDHDLAMF